LKSKTKLEAKKTKPGPKENTCRKDKQRTSLLAPTGVAN